MDKLKKHFVTIRARFADKKDFFQRKMDTWKRYGKVSLYKQAKLLFDEAQNCQAEIDSVFDNSDWKYNKAFLKVKINAFEGLIKELNTMTRSFFLRWVEIITVVTVVVFLLRTFFFGIYLVSSSAAEPALLVGDRIWGNKFMYLFHEPKCGEMVMFQDPKFEYDKKSLLSRVWQKHIGAGIEKLGLKSGPKYMAKRIVACPGDVVEGRIEDGRPIIYRNGKKINEPYVNTYPLLALRKELGFISGDTVGSVKIPEFLKFRTKNVLYSYDPKKDFEEQPFYYIDYKNVLYDQSRGYMKTYKSGLPVVDKSGKYIDIFGPYIVPEKKYWVMGDNRRNSIDSREWGLVGREKISGKASFVIWSLDSEEPFWFFDFIKNPFRFVASLRLRRFFKKIK